MSLRFAILGLLAAEPQTGYELQKTFDASVSYFWQARFQQIYGELRGLQREGLVSGREVPRAGQATKVVYSLTPKGEAALDRWLDTPAAMAPVRDEFLVRVAHIDRLPRERAVARVREHRRLHEERLGTYRAIEQRLREAGVTDASVPAPMLGRYLTLRCGIGYEEHVLTWCDWALGVLEKNHSVAAGGSTRGSGREPAIATPRSTSGRTRAGRQGASRRATGVPSATRRARGR